ncbi:MAG TPA: SAM-dependent chlorinase/fluorinase [Candidatus Polarisedimenticolia bacterium]|nr:SAM-dependent chlorinase/fluorinase [Candidatus Polarisedimenticolia bacterium]
MTRDSMALRTPILTLTTDFGYEDGYVASVKGVIFSLNPAVRIVDICHGVRPQGVVEGGFVLASAFSLFPPGTLHLLIVDPGVGTSRRLLLARTENHLFLGPDNGALGLVFEHEPVQEVFSLTASHYFRPEVSATFQGRDILAPVAAWVSRGTALSHFGEPVTDWIRFPVPPPTRESDGRICLHVLHVDRFGNTILNLREATFREMRDLGGGGSAQVEIGGTRIGTLLRTYGEAVSEAPFALFNSAGYLELATRNGSAAAILSAQPGQPAFLSFQPGSSPGLERPSPVR